jgi:transposase
VKPFVKRQRNDAADAKAIAEAALRPTMRFVAIKSQEQQARGMIFRTRDLLVRRRTQLINALRGHLAEYGIVAHQGVASVKLLADAIEAVAVPLPLRFVELARLYLDQIEALDAKITDLEKVLKREAGRGDASARLQTMPGIGPITAMAIETLTPPIQTLNRGRDFAAWGAKEAGWLTGMLACKPRMLVAVALANKMARSAWTLLTKDEDFKIPACAAV